MAVETSEERNEWEHVRVTKRAPSERSKRAGRRAMVFVFLTWGSPETPEAPSGHGPLSRWGQPGADPPPGGVLSPSVWGPEVG